MAVRTVALIFDDKVRPDTTGVYCRRALGPLVEVRHFQPLELDRVPRQGFDLYLRIDDGLEYHLPRSLRPAACWAIDTHLNYSWYLESAPEFDWVFTAQRDGAERLRRDGVEANWLPLACDPEVHRKHSIDKAFDFCFVGHVFEGPRAELVRLLQKRFPRSFVGQRFFDEMARAYSASRVVFNRSIRNDVNMRVFEALACGSLLVTNDLRDNGQEELARDGAHLATYRDEEELLDKVMFYLKRDEARERIAAAGMALAQGRHTYRQRMEALLAQVGAELTSRAVGVAAQATPEGGPWGLTSIVILTHNQLAYTRECLDSVRAHTEQPYELIAIDNASTDGTVEYLRSLPGVKLICNSENRGFPAGCNQGVRAALGRQVLLLNNDTVVPAGWLERLLRRLYSDTRIGLVGPCSNRVSGEQQVPAEYDTLSGMEAFARGWTREHDGQARDTDRLVGFCLLMRRELVDRIGLLDERFGVGCYEDDDYCLRALQAGYRVVIALDAFVHHYAGRTFSGSGIDYPALMASNRLLFEAKWRDGAATPADVAAAPAPIAGAVPRPVYGLRAGRGDGLRLERKGPLLSLCMIVRNNAGTIRPCLESIKPWVDEMIVLDTGSEDDTPRIAAELGARVERLPWPDSFAAARNESLKYARGRWIFWMDSDDTIPPDCGRRLRELVLRETSPGTLGYVVQVRCPGAGEDSDEVTVVDHVKLFRNRPDLRFEHRIHEQVLPAINRAGGQVEFTDAYVVHSGYDHSPEGQRRKLERDLKLLHLEEAEWPNHPFTLFNLGMTYTDTKRYEEALGYLRRCLACSREGESHTRKAHAYVATCHQGLGRLEEALEACEEGLRLFPLDAELRFRKANLLHLCGRLDDAVQVYHDLLGRHEENHYKSVVAGISGHIARHNLAIVRQDQGDLARAEEQWRLVVRDKPDYRRGWRGLGSALLARGRHAEAQRLAERLLRDHRLRAEGLLLKGQVAAARGDRGAARAAWQQVARDCPRDRDALQQASQLLFEQVGPAAAEGALRALTLCDPEDGAAWHNLGTVHLLAGMAQEAVEAYRASLRYRPGMAHTQVQLGHALQASGRAEEAVAAWREVLQVHPGQPEALAALRQAGQLPRDTAPDELAKWQVSSTTPLAIEGRLQVRGPVDRAIIRDLCARDVYQVRSIREPVALVVDVGAHIGVFALLSAETWPAARIIACEPDPENAALLRRNLSGHRQIEVVEAAIVGRDLPVVGLYAVADKAGGNSGGSSCVRPEPGSKRLEVTALSVVRLWQTKAIARCDLLKLDCEGAEAEILRALADAGLLGSICRIAGEWHAPDDRPGTTAAVRRELVELLERTHQVTFEGPSRGREGHFHARAQRWPP